MAWKIQITEKRELSTIPRVRVMCFRFSWHVISPFLIPMMLWLVQRYWKTLSRRWLSNHSSFDNLFYSWFHWNFRIKCMFKIWDDGEAKLLRLKDRVLWCVILFLTEETPNFLTWREPENPFFRHNSDCQNGLPSNLLLRITNQKESCWNCFAGFCHVIMRIYLIKQQC